MRIEFLRLSPVLRRSAADEGAHLQINKHNLIRLGEKKEEAKRKVCSKKLKSFKEKIAQLK